MPKPRVYGFIYFTWLLLLGTILRLLFYLRYWYPAPLGQHIAGAFLWGFRFDFSILFFLNLPFFMYWVLVYPRGGTFSRMLLWVGLWGMNVLLVAINLFDLVYFGFNNRRSTVDLLYVMSDGFTANRASFAQYGGYILLLLGAGLLAYWLVKRMLRAAPFSLQQRWPALVTPVLLLLAGWWLASGRQNLPFTPPDALLYVETTQVPLAENSGATFLYSVFKRQEELKPVPANDVKALDSLFTIRRQFDQADSFRHMNVVVFILESFSSAVIDSGSASKAVTPFIDSLRLQSIDCSNAFSNGLESNKGIVALLGSIPPLLQEPFYYSSFNTVPFRGIGTILKDSGYQTHFFMGASPDHFGFGKWCRMLGIDHYYSEKEYGNPADHDGHWGIYDHKFLQYAASVLTASPKPFFATVFNISSHPPFALPPGLQKRFTIAGQTQRQNSVSYADYALRLFFDQIRNESWYKNTLFVFAADHVLLERRNIRSDLYNYLHIPVFIHLPGEAKHVAVDRTVQQLDIVPTVLDLLHFRQPFMAFGQSILRPHAGFSVCRIFETDQLIDSAYITGYQPATDSVAYFYPYRTDTALAKNLAADTAVQNLLQPRRRFVRAFGQRFNQALLQRQLMIQ